jgi:hypothetical protein
MGTAIAMAAGGPTPAAFFYSFLHYKDTIQGWQCHGYKVFYEGCFRKDCC